MSPEDEITLLRVLSLDVLALLVLVLCLRRAWNRSQTCLADGISRQAGAVEPAI